MIAWQTDTDCAPVIGRSNGQMLHKFRHGHINIEAFMLQSMLLQHENAAAGAGRASHCNHSEGGPEGAGLHASPGHHPS